MQFQGGDEAQRIMDSEKIKSALINPVKKKKKKETNISRPIDFEINSLPLSRGGGKSYKG